MVRFDLLQGQRRKVKLKSAYKSLIIGPRGLQCETKLQDIMGWESSDMVRFVLGPLLQGQTVVHGSGGLSCQWIQFASVLQCAR